MNKINKDQIKEWKTTMKKTPEFMYEDICDTWFLNIDELSDDIKSKQKLLRLALRERKLQPRIKTINSITEKIRILEPGYKIMLNKESILYTKDW